MAITNHSDKFTWRSYETVAPSGWVLHKFTWRSYETVAPSGWVLQCLHNIMSHLYDVICDQWTEKCECLLPGGDSESGEYDGWAHPIRHHSHAVSPRGFTCIWLAREVLSECLQVCLKCTLSHASVPAHFTCSPAIMHACTRMHACTHACKYTCPFLFLHAHQQSCMHACTHAHTHTRTHAHTHTRTHAHTHTRIHAHIHMHTAWSRISFYMCCFYSIHHCLFMCV